MPRVKLVRISTSAPDLDQLAAAILAQDADGLGNILDHVFEFRGPVGGFLEGIDGVVWDELALFLITYLPDLVDRLTSSDE